MGERIEALLRIVIGLVSGFVLGVWKILIIVIGIINWIIVIISGKRNRRLAEISEIWNTQKYLYLRYMIFVSNKRPFPFDALTKNLAKFRK